MNKLTKYIKNEMDAEIFSCVHTISMISVYSFLIFLADGKGLVDFLFILLVAILGYVISWGQKLLFLKEKIYTKLEYRIRVLVWILVPNVLTFFVGRMFSWFANLESFIEPVFYLIMLIYYIMIWFFLSRFYNKDTKELNQELENFKRKRFDFPKDK